MKFSEFNLSDVVNTSIKELRFTEPTKVQEIVIPAILEGKDVVVKAKTGSGKTCAFAIPIVDKLEVLATSPKVLVITPTRELAIQVCDEFNKLGKNKEIKSIVVYGKSSIQTQIEQLEGTVHVVVGTPGRVNDLLRREALILDSIDYFVLDEADELLNRGFLDEISEIINGLPTKYNTLLLSATMPREIQHICDKYMNEPIWVEIKEEAPKIHEINYCVEDAWKFLKLREVIESINPFNCLIFCNTQSSVNDLYNRMKQVGQETLMLHGGMKQRERQKSIDSFKKGDYRCLIATDLAARGIHIDSLDLVVNYDVPQIPENYVHRIGRTGRVGEEGIAVTFFSPTNKADQLELEKYLGIQFTFSEFETDVVEKTNMHLSRSEKRLSHNATFPHHF